MTKLKQKKDEATKAKEKKARQQKKAAKAATKASAGKTEASPPKTAIVKKEPGAEEDDCFGFGNGNNTPVTPKVVAKPAATAAALPASTAAANGAAKEMCGSSHWRALNAATAVRSADTELARGTGPLCDFINSQSSSKYNQVPRLNIKDFSEKPEKYEMYALLWKWVKGQRTKMHFARCKVVDPFCEQPDCAPDDEPAVITADINTRNLANHLVMVKKVDPQTGAITRRHFNGHTVSVLLVSADLIFCIEKTD